MPSFRNVIIQIKENKNENNVLHLIKQIFNLMKDAKKSMIISIDDFISSIRKNNSEFNNDNHHDAHEFLIFLLDSIEQALKSDKNNLVK